MKIAQKFATSFGQKLTKKKLGQFVPFAGVGVGAFMNWKMIDDVADAAYWAYRERFLYEKGGEMDPMTIDGEFYGEAEIHDQVDSPIDVIEILESEGIHLDNDEGTGDDSVGSGS